ncbi:PQQ-binding-like beta-propeller repeat protein [Streptomyces sp. NPDC004542]|uniref:serine/threonine-protein kinase n=1 Tax=Streptomyces sp. NPDC004542 TaxID=3154281 RepID=UPI0033A0512B
MAPQRNAGAGAEAELPEYAGHYHLESRLGSGGMGVVHLARSTSGMKVAVKVVHAEFARDPEFRGRFRQEVAAARRVSGAFTAPVVDADPEAERPWMATLFIPGQTLAGHVKEHGAMSPDRLRRLMAGLAEALRDIHRVGVVHRDLKPSNVLLAEDGPKVIDFGISRPKDSELRTETGKLIGTPPFMAPEQFRRPREVGPAADVFALGSVMVHAATGRGPFDSDSPYVVAYQVVHDEPDLTGVPENLAPLVLRCLAKEPEERPTPDALMRELRSVAASYDTQTFIPAQRTSVPTSADGERTDRERADGERADGEPADGEPVAEPEAGEPEAAEPEAAEPEVDQPEVAAPVAAPEVAAYEVTGPRPTESGGRPRRRRVRWAALTAGVLALVVGGAVASVRLADGSGPQPAGGGSHTVAAGASADGFMPWAEKPGSGDAGMPQCSATTAALVCAQSGRVYALSPSDGSLLWRRSAATSLGSGAPVLSGGLVQVLTDQGRRVAALDPVSGTVRRQQDVPAGGGMRFAGDILLLTAADGTVTGVDSASGRTKWHHRIPGQTMPLFTWFTGDRVAYTTSTSADGSRTRVTAVDPGTGDVRWEALLDGSLRPVGTSGGSAYFLAVDRVYGATQAVVRYSPASRTARRVALSVSLEDAHATVRGDVVYLLATGGSLEAVDTGARRRLWRLQTSVIRGSTPVADGGHVYVSTPDGRLLAVDARTGALVGQTRARLGTRADRVTATLPEPVVIKGRVYASAPDGTVFAVDGHDPAGW